MIIPNTPTFVLQLHHVETTATITKLGRKKTVKSHVECVKVSSMVRCLRNTNRVQKKVETSVFSFPRIPRHNFESTHAKGPLK